jgi:hypothetical protein
MIEFALGLLTGCIISGWLCWTAYTKEMNEWKEIFKVAIAEITGYENLKKRIK